MIQLDPRRGSIGLGSLALAFSSLLLVSESTTPTKSATVAEASASASPAQAVQIKPKDEFHPDRGDEKAPLYGGRVIVHIPSLPENACYPIENSAITRRIQYEVHETLLLQDWFTTKYVPNASSSWVEEDLVLLNEDAPKVDGEIEATVVRRDGGQGQRVVRAVYGVVKEAGDGVTVTPASDGSSLEAAVTIPGSSVERVERGSVFTFKIRPGIKWQKSLVYTDPEHAEAMSTQTLDARDVHFSWSIYSNPDVECDEKRFQFEKITDCQIVDDLTVRFFYEKQYAFALDSIGTSLTLLASHIYDLSDPDCPDHDEGASVKKQAEHINKNDHNQLWVGIGPYQITNWDQQYVQADRFRDASGAPAYFDKETRAGYFDTIRWRYIEDDQTAFNALMNGEVDWFERVKPSDYFGASTESDAFKESFYKGYFYLGDYGYTGWNLYNPALQDIAVRKAIAHAFDFDAYLESNYKGLARQQTGPVPYESPGYAHDVVPLEYDPEKSIDLLEEAGWYDRDGNGIADKNGVELEIEFLYPNGNDASKKIGRTLQAALEELDIKVNLATLEWATFLQRMKSREFDSVNLAWVPPLESDPEQLWHSKWGARDLQSSNNSGLQDEHADEIIAKIQAEVDRDKRMLLWQEFHRYIYSLQPYLFLYNVPKKFGASLKVRGIQNSPISPGYVIRDWYYVDSKIEGTRKTL